MPRIDMDRRTALYRLFDTEGRLLYVGITFNPDNRWAEHATSKSWWVDVADKHVEWHESRTVAAAAEVAAIAAGLPLYNKHDSPQPYEGSTVKEGAKASRIIRIDDDTWEDYGRLCEEKGIARAADIRMHIKREIKAYQQRQRAES
ncbi:GIY-YIG nuclease family protein [Streptomyces sp. NPDC094153]|uniref:GIY-YIG nuclease family protein n=1 Tax=Streptomyces sp. NPDC094153 TaxID=3366058 RepID=UPI0037F9C7D5